MRVEFTVPGRPVPQSRPDVYRNGGVKSNSDAVAAYKQVIQMLCPRRTPLHGPVKLSVIAWMKRPSKSPKGTKWHTCRPDGDNILKAVQDALNKTAFHDDGQIADSQIVKRVVENKADERTEIILEELF